MTRVKLCGLTRPEDVRAAASLGAEYMGFVLAPSRRQVTAADVARLRKETAADGPSAVLVTVDLDLDQTLSAAETAEVAHVQLCGDEPPELCAALRTRGLTVWKAWGVRGGAADEEAARYRGAVDALLLDTRRAGLRGGTGEAFSWDDIPKLAAYLPDVPLVVAGGLRPETVADLVRLHRPWGVDVSSGIETDGRKDPQKMAAFMRAARSVTDVS